MNNNPLSWYYTETPVVNVTNFTSNIIDTSSLVSTSVFNTNTNVLSSATMSNTSNIINLYNLLQGKQDGDPFWDDIIGSIVGGVTNAGLETLGDVLLRQFDTGALKDGFSRIVGDVLGDALDTDGGTSWPGDANNAPLGSNVIQADFRFLSKNPFAVSRSRTFDYNYGIALAGQDLCLTPSANICLLGDQHVTQGPYGYQYTDSMTTVAKSRIFETSTLSWTCSNVFAGTQIRTPNFIGNNLAASNVTISQGISTQSLQVAGSLSSPAAQIITPSFSNTSSSNLVVTNSATINSIDTNSWRVGPAFTPYASVDPAGAMNAFSLQVNGNAFVIQSDGSLYVNGTQLIDGPNKSIIVYDDQIRQRSVRASVSDVTSGNIGSTDTKLFGNPQNVSKPLSFDDLANRTFIRNAIAGAQNTSWWI